MNKQLAAPIIELDDISKSFNRNLFRRPSLALDHTSFQIRRGLCTGLMGHNGAGKTTCIKIILGLIQNFSGQVHYNDRAMQNQDRRNIGYMPELNKLPANFSCTEVLSGQLHLQRPKLNRRRVHRTVERSLARIGLTDFAQSRVGALSKGMARRLGWANATIHKPNCLILDEPFSGLDPDSQESMVKWIYQEKAAGTTILLSTHDLNTAIELCDDLVVLRQGKVELSEQQTASIEKQVHFELRVSSGRLEDFLAEGRRFQLEKPSSLLQENFLTIARFNNYNSAKAWLEVISKSDLAILSFCDAPAFDAERIRALFRQP